MPDEARQEWMSEMMRALQAQQAVLVRLDRAERDVQEQVREVAALRAQLDAFSKELTSKLDGLKAWLVGALIALILNLLAFLITNLGRFFSAPVR